MAMAMPSVYGYGGKSRTPCRPAVLPSSTGRSTVLVSGIGSSGRYWAKQDSRISTTSVQCSAIGASEAALQSFSGLRIDHKLQSESAFGCRSLGIGNGSRFFLMRHGRRVPKLNRPPDQRRALLRGLTTQLLRHGRIKTTRARAKALRPHVEHMLTLAKGGSLHQRRQALGYIYDKQLVHALFAEVPDRYSERNGGYTRIIRTMPRRGDNAPMSYIELV